MRITLVQAEIDQAIVNYINSQVNVKDGMSITVDLSATRGENGFTATIDIVHANSPRITRDVPAKTIPVTVVEPTKETVKPVELATPTPLVAYPQTTTTTPTVEEEKQTTQEQPVAAATQVNPLATPVAERPRSLFAGLQKPTNQPS